MDTIKLARNSYKRVTVPKEIAFPEKWPKRLRRKFETTMMLFGYKKYSPGVWTHVNAEPKANAKRKKVTKIIKTKIISDRRIIKQRTKEAEQAVIAFLSLEENHNLVYHTDKKKTYEILKEKQLLLTLRRHVHEKKVFPWIESIGHQLKRDHLKKIQSFLDEKVMLRLDAGEIREMMREAKLTVLPDGSKLSRDSCNQQVYLARNRQGAKAKRCKENNHKEFYELYTQGKSKEEIMRILNLSSHLVWQYSAELGFTEIKRHKPKPSANQITGANYDTNRQ